MSDLKTIIGIAVGLTVGIIMVTTAIIPLTSSYVDGVTYENSGVFYVEVNPVDTYTIEYDKDTDPGVVIINDEPVTVSFVNGYTILALDQSILRLQSGDTTIQYKGDGSYITGIKWLDITVHDGAVTGTYKNNSSGETEVEWPTTTYTECHIISSEKQDYVMTEYNVVSKVKGDSDIFAFGQTLMNGVIYLIKIEGNIKDGVDVSILNSTSGDEITTAVISNLSINSTPINGYVDLYNLSSITFTVTIEDSPPVDVTYSAYIIPTKVSAENVNPPQYKMIVKVLPLMAFIGLIVVAASFAYIKGKN